jgi:hypothetical protein
MYSRYALTYANTLHSYVHEEDVYNKDIDLDWYPAELAWQVSYIGQSTRCILDTNAEGWMHRLRMFRLRNSLCSFFLLGSEY